jgi:hypothetical protein
MSTMSTGRNGGPWGLSCILFAAIGSVRFAVWNPTLTLSDIAALLVKSEHILVASGATVWKATRANGRQCKLGLLFDFNVKSQTTSIL